MWLDLNICCAPSLFCSKIPSGIPLTSSTGRWAVSSYRGVAFRNMSRTALGAGAGAGVSTTGLSSIERGMNSGKQTRDKIARALAIPADALIPVF
jgi:hypothetical protein